MSVSWLQKAVLQSNKPKASIIALLKSKLAGMEKGRNREVVHASDITKPNFCPRQWAFLDMMKVQSKPQYKSLALAVTYAMGHITEKVLIEDWMGEYAVGNWKCRRCNGQVSLSHKPKNGCLNSQDCQWEYHQFAVLAPEFAISGSVDCLFDLGTPLLVITEIKTLNPDDFDKMVVAQPEHRLRTALYMKVLSTSVYKEKFNLLEARVVYVSRGYGKKNIEWGEILPFKEFVVQRDDESIKVCLQRAKALKVFRDEGKMPSGICKTVTDKYAKHCSVVKECFSGAFPALIQIDELKVD